MKKILFSAVLVVFLLGSFSSYAQSKGKMGHIDSNSLLMLMPERATATKAIEEHAKQLQEQLQTMSQEFETKYADYTEKQATMSDLIKKNKEQELADLQKRIQDFQTTAQQDLQNKEQELMQPIIDKAKKAIEDVAKEKGYDYVFDTSVGALVYWPESSDDLLPLVKKKLGIE